MSFPRRRFAGVIATLCCKNEVHPVDLCWEGTPGRLHLVFSGLFPMYLIPLLILPRVLLYPGMLLAALAGVLC